MKRIFVDANIVVDLLCERYPWFPSVMRIFNMADLGQIELYCSSLSLGTASYLMEARKISPQDIFDGIDLLCQMCTPSGKNYGKSKTLKWAFSKTLAFR